jgi:tetratricopeptide (TPR) repeat protein
MNEQPSLSSVEVPLPSSYPLPPPSASPTRPRFQRVLHGCLVLPRAALRHPGRTLVILLLLSFIAAGGGIAGVWMWATYHLRCGRTELERYHTAEAVPHLQAVLSVWPRDPETLLLAARAARRSGALDEAEQFLDRYQELLPNDENLTLERIFVRTERGEVESTAKYLRSLLDQQHPASSLIFEATVRGLSRCYQPRNAEKVSQEWLEREPGNPQALLLLGRIHDLQLHQADAVKAYRAALTIDPSLDEARLHLCAALMQLGLVEEAQPHLEYLHGRFPNNPMVQVYLARIRDRQGQTQAAEQMLDDLLAHQPHFAPALAERGKWAWRAGQSVEAEKWLREAINREPSDYQAHYHLFLCLEKNKKTEEARKEQEQIKQMEQDIKEIQDIAGGAMERTPHNADLHYQIGMISLRAGAVTEALRWLNSAVKENPHHDRAHKALMEYYQRIGDFGRAREHQRQMSDGEQGRVSAPSGSSSRDADATPLAP